jgi:taurine dioxygenase
MPGDAAPQVPVSDYKLIHPKPLCGALGAEIAGVDLARLDDALFAEIKAAFHEHIVLVFPDQQLTPDQQVAFTARFGPVEEHPLKSRPGLPAHPEVLVLVNQPGNRGARNDIWHSDISFSDTPPLGSVLYGIEVPEGYGDTMFCNMRAAYAALSPALQAMLRPLKARHSAAGLAQRNNAGDGNASPIAQVPDPAVHPVVRTHPGTGLPALYVNPWFTLCFDGMSEAESRPLLDFLASQATGPENVYRHRWRRHDVVMWDNRAAMHYAVRDYDESQVRIMHRTTALGDRPV